MEENSEKNSKKIQKIKKPLSGIIFGQNSHRPRNREKNFSPEFYSYQTRATEFQKKKQKTKKPLSGIIFSQNGTRSAEKKRKKILVPNSIHTRPGQDNSEKNSKKIKKTLSGIIFSQNGMRLVEKE